MCNGVLCAIVLGDNMDFVFHYQDNLVTDSIYHTFMIVLKVYNECSSVR